MEIKRFCKTIQISLDFQWNLIGRFRSVKIWFRNVKFSMQNVKNSQISRKLIEFSAFWKSVLSTYKIKERWHTFPKLCHLPYKQRNRSWNYQLQTPATVQPCHSSNCRSTDAHTQCKSSELAEIYSKLAFFLKNSTFLLSIEWSFLMIHCNDDHWLQLAF
jgi:hypothetical protein